MTKACGFLQPTLVRDNLTTDMAPYPPQPCFVSLAAGSLPDPAPHDPTKQLLGLQTRLPLHDGITSLHQFAQCHEPPSWFAPWTVTVRARSTITARFEASWRLTGNHCINAGGRATQEAKAEARKGAHTRRMQPFSQRSGVGSSDVPTWIVLVEQAPSQYEAATKFSSIDQSTQAMCNRTKRNRPSLRQQQTPSTDYPVLHNNPAGKTAAITRQMGLGLKGAATRGPFLSAHQQIHKFDSGTSGHRLTQGNSRKTLLSKKSIQDPPVRAKDTR